MPETSFHSGAVSPQLMSGNRVTDFALYLKNPETFLQTYFSSKFPKLRNVLCPVPPTPDTFHVESEPPSSSHPYFGMIKSPSLDLWSLVQRYPCSQELSFLYRRSSLKFSGEGRPHRTWTRPYGDASQTAVPHHLQ